MISALKRIIIISFAVFLYSCGNGSTSDSPSSPDSDDNSALFDAPQLVLEEYTVTAERDSLFADIEPGYSAVDRNGNDITAEVQRFADINLAGPLDAPGEYEVRYSVSEYDEDDNLLTAEATLTLVVLDAEETPLFDFLLIVLEGGTVYADQGSDYIEPGYYGRDRYGNSLTTSIVVSSDIDLDSPLDVPGEYEITYSVSEVIDSSTVLTAEKTRILVVEEVDDSLPFDNLLIELVGGTVYADEGTVFDEPGFTARDRSGNDIASLVQVSADIDLSSALDVVGEYEITYSVAELVDGGPPLTAEVTRTLVVEAATLSDGPQILLDENIVYVEVGSFFEEPEITAVDSYGVDIPSWEVQSPGIDLDGPLNVPGGYEITYSVVEQVDGGPDLTAEAILTLVVFEDIVCPAECSGSCIKAAAQAPYQCASEVSGSVELSNALAIEASQTTCIAPCGVHFAAEVLGDFGVEMPFHHLAYHWSFDDAGSFFRSLDEDFPFGRDANRAQGPFAAHVFEHPGAYTVALNVTSGGANPRHSVAYVNIEVLSPEDEDVFSASETLCISQAGDFSGCPSGAERFTSWSAAASTIDSANRAYVLFHAGEVYEMQEGVGIGGQDFVFTRYGTGTDPVFVVDGIGSVIDVERRVDSVSVSYLDVRGSYDPRTGLGDSYADHAFRFGHGSSGTDTANAFNATQFRTTVSGMGYCMSPTGGEAHVYADNHCTNWYNFGSLQQHNVDKVAYVGNHIKQSTLAVSGPDQKWESGVTYSANGTTRTYDYDFEVLPVSPLPGSPLTGLVHYSDLDADDIDPSVISNLAVAVTINGEQEFLTEGVDYSHNTSSQSVTFNQAPVDGASVELFHRRWADHGPIRVADAVELVVSQNDMYVKTGWFGDGKTHHPVYRYNSNGDPNHSGVTVENVMEGGNMVAIYESANSGIRMGSGGQQITERNILIGSSSTRYTIRNAFGGATFRNNLMFQPDVLTHTNPYVAGVFLFENYEAPSPLEDEDGNVIRDVDGNIVYEEYTDPENFTLPVEIYNNTIINLSDDSLYDTGGISPAEFLAVKNDDHHDGGPTFTDVTVVNNKTYAPQSEHADAEGYRDIIEFNVGTYEITFDVQHSSAQSHPGLHDTLLGQPHPSLQLEGAVPEAEAGEPLILNVLNALSD